MKKMMLFVFVMIIMTALLVERTSVAQQSSGPIFQAKDNNSVCQPGPVNLSELAGNVKAHSVRLGDLECLSMDMTNKVRLLANQADDARKAATTDEQKAGPEAVVQKAEKQAKELKKLHGRLAEIRAIKANSPFAKRLTEVLTEETAVRFQEVAEQVGKLKIDLQNLSERVRTLEGKVDAHGGRLDQQNARVFQLENDVSELKVRGAGLGVHFLVLGSRGGASLTLGLRLGLPVSLRTEIGLAAGAGVSSRGKVLAWDGGIDLSTWVGWRFFMGPALFVSSTNTERQGVHNLMAGAGVQGRFLLSESFELVARAGVGPYLTSAPAETYFGWSTSLGFSYRFF